MSKDPRDLSQWDAATGIIAGQQTATSELNQWSVLGSARPPAGGVESPTFKPGDVVQLKSGGLPMVVRKRAKSGLIAVLWFGDGASLLAASLPPETLITVEQAARVLEQLPGSRETVGP